MTKYDEGFKPPAPIAKIALRNTETGERVHDVPMLLDTGEEVSLVPKSFVEQLGVSPLPDESFVLEGFNNSKSIAETVFLQVVFLNRRFAGKFCLVEQNYGILGRDILNHVSLLFDGLNLNLKEADDAQIIS